MAEDNLGRNLNIEYEDLKNSTTTNGPSPSTLNSGNVDCSGNWPQPICSCWKAQVTSTSAALYP
ncbi:MAG TPA: hypothetical protein PLQ01_10175 [Methanothrix sp.]|nr:hypothetical protein [Methanothrix sp.]